FQPRRLPLQQPKTQEWSKEYKLNEKPLYSSSAFIFLYWHHQHPTI
ncbi:unnamed protein product, partial [Prunus brigantina]